MEQTEPFKFCPCCGKTVGETVMTAEGIRCGYTIDIIWRFNPWTGVARPDEEITDDPQGRKINPLLEEGA